MSRVLWGRVGMKCEVTEDEFAEVLNSLEATEEEFFHGLEDIQFTDALNKLFSAKGIVCDDSYLVGYSNN